MGKLTRTFRHQVLKVPADWAVLICKEKLFREAQVLLWLKCLYGDRIRITEGFNKDLGNALGVCARTVRRALKVLVSRNWIGQASGNDIIYPRSFETIRAIEAIPSRRAFLLRSMDLCRTKEFLISEAISIYIKRKLYVMRRRGQRIGGPQKRVGHFKSSNLAPVALSNVTLAKFLKISNSTASVFKDIAIKAGYITRKRSFKAIELPKGYVMSKWSGAIYEQYYPEHKGRIRLYKGKLSLQVSDLIASNMVACRRGQIPMYNKGYSRDHAKIRD